MHIEEDTSLDSRAVVAVTQEAEVCSALQQAEREQNIVDLVHEARNQGAAEPRTAPHMAVQINRN